MMEELQKELKMEEFPDHIECFDNSNFQGSSPVASVVVFKNGKPAKKDYRHFKIRTVEGPNDFASMTEIVHRRYKRLLNENQPLPKLIIIDGGKGQLSAAHQELIKLGVQIPLVSLAKREEEVFLPNKRNPVKLSLDSLGLKLLQRTRDEAHRFAVKYHRHLRDKNVFARKPKEDS